MKDGDVSALSMRAVARRAGVSHQAPYHYFADREAILAELVREGFELLYAREEEAVQGLTASRERMVAIGMAYVRFALENPALFRLMFRCDMVDIHDHETAHAAADKAFNVPFNVIDESFEGEEEDKMTAVVGCWSLAHGLATLALEGILENKLEEVGVDTGGFIERTLGLFTRRLLG